mmetsp:Transcript_44740/g.71815  ORF Transcript_44740/g.71815 Transcript_44740/m.71815 type:complete len:241 (-) Transcript_44740:1201-1923(-)
MRRSPSSKPYGMFHPMGPNPRRSCTKPWQKARQKHSFLNTSGLLHVSKNSEVAIGSSWYERRMFARRPRGGSFVILTPFCKMATGNEGLGRDVSHNLKLASADSGLIPSQIFSRLGIQEAAKWQFCRSTHFPVCTASFMSTAALGPWPCPMDITLMSVSFPMSAANFNSAVVGSDPGDNTKSNGVVALDSAYEPGRSNGGGSVNFRPMVDSTKSFTAGRILSGRKHRRSRSCWNGVGSFE